MSLNKPWPKRRPLRALLLASTLLSGCVTIQEATLCSPAGDLSLGGICSHLISKTTAIISFREMLDLINPQEDRTCVPLAGMPVCADDQSSGKAVDLPARGGSFVISESDFGQLKTEVDQMCREMGPSCTIAQQRAIEAAFSRLARR